MLDIPYYQNIMSIIIYNNGQTTYNIMGQVCKTVLILAKPGLPLSFTLGSNLITYHSFFALSKNGKACNY